MRIVRNISLFLLLIFSFGQAAYAKPKSAAPAPVAPAPTTVLAVTVPQEEVEDSSSRFKLSGDVNVLEGLQSDFGIGANMGYAFRLGPVVPVYFGMDMGFSRWVVKYQTSTGEGDQKVTTDGYAFVTSIQVLATLYYRFLDHPKSRAHPYIGISVGPSLVSSDNEAVMFGDQPLSNKSTAVKFQVLLRPGVEIDLFESVGINLEPKVGIFNGHLLFAPSVGLTFGL